ncbi:biotin/lipoyl-containing protein [Hydrocarboniphaga sp.]|uniref:biotin/lipoyl-containing protein n=1 Tax=Hydrocarboniphaga sp. TaxID=2033016 RepID=UPI003D11B3F5
MATEIRIPKIGISMTEATLSEWMVADGSAVEAGAPLYAIEMEKSATEVPSPASGKLKIIAEIGEVYEVGTLIATIE